MDIAVLLRMKADGGGDWRSEVLRGGNGSPEMTSTRKGCTSPSRN